MGKQKKSGYIHFWSVRAREEGTKTNKQPVTHSFVSTQLSSTRGILQHHKRVIKLVELHASVCVWETFLFRCCRVRRPGGSVVAGGCFNVGFFGGVSFSLTVPTRYGMSLVFFSFWFSCAGGSEYLHLGCQKNQSGQEKKKTTHSSLKKRETRGGSKKNIIYVCDPFTWLKWLLLIWSGLVGGDKKSASLKSALATCGFRRGWEDCKILACSCCARVTNLMTSV